jgi:hypothetical protein
LGGEAPSLHFWKWWIHILIYNRYAYLNHFYSVDVGELIFGGRPYTYWTPDIVNWKRNRILDHDFSLSGRQVRRRWNNCHNANVETRTHINSLTTRSCH